MIKTYTYGFETMDISPEEVSAMMGYSEEGVPEPFHNYITQALAQAPGISDIRGGYRILDVTFPDRRTTRLEGISFDTNDMVTAFLKKSTRVAVFVCTAGQGISDRIKELNKKGMLSEGYTLDVIGSITVERAMDKIQQSLKKDISGTGEHITNRYSPGYCGWDTGEQGKLFSLLPDGFCDITLTESSLMIPTKSVSGFIGIGKDVVYRDYACDSCTSEHCIYRRR